MAVPVVTTGAGGRIGDGETHVLKARQRVAGSEVLQALTAFFYVMLARGGGTAATLVYTVILVRLLTPEEFGAVSSLWSLALLLVPLATLNLAPVAIRTVVAARQAGDDALAAGFVAFTRRVNLVAAPVAMALFLGIVWLRFPDLLGAATAGIGLTAVAILGMAQVQTGAAIGVALDKAAATQVPRELVRPVMLLAALLVVAAFGLPLSLSGALMLYCATVLVNIALQAHLLREAMAFVTAQPPRIENARSWVATGLFLLPTRMVNDNAKLVMIVAASAVLPLDQVALITVALSVSGLLNFAISSVEISFSAKLSRALHAGDTGRITRFLAVAGGVKVLLCAGMVAVVALLLDPLLALFGTHYAVADDITLILLGIPLVQALFGKADLVLLVHDLRHRIFWIQLVTLLLLPASAALSLLLPGLDATRLTAAGYVCAFGFGYGALWWTARAATGIDTSAPGALLRFLRARRQTPPGDGS
ncbi:hypothetical protein RISW2_15020 [Roseivivax isoporae LMG 25204]|uniref:Polysaccharide biosynthesis protein n=1 Tax=Roseivivax isoporae LMG 25204 TaxID=1449351 RepID=X7F350_9RHOB|nr:hypothetical protein RISW2_15020 [Roseivivax isoporae LMG 25204]